MKKLVPPFAAKFQIRFKRGSRYTFTFTFICHPGKTHNKAGFTNGFCADGEGNAGISPVSTEVQQDSHVDGVGAIVG